MVTTTSTNAATNVPWSVDVEFFVEAIGSSGVVSSAGTAQIVSGNSNARATGVGQDLARSVDLTTGLEVSVGANTATANAGNIVRVERAYLTKVAEAA